jgi:hypothetical protein
MVLATKTVAVSAPENGIPVPAGGEDAGIDDHDVRHREEGRHAADHVGGERRIA